jgi:protein-tyrosine phosphatase
VQKVLFVCMGNICRSPTAEGVFRRLVDEAGLSDRIDIESAGTHDYHVGASPDPRARQAAHGRGIDLSALRARQVRDDDFAAFGWIVAMDQANLRLLQGRCPPAHRHKLSLLLDHAPQETAREVPDPYYGGDRGFEHVLDLVEAGGRGLLVKVRAALEQ